MSVPYLRKCLFCDGEYVPLDPRNGDIVSTMFYTDTKLDRTASLRVKLVSCPKCNNVQSFLEPDRPDLT